MPKNLLLEIGTEEIPAKFMAGALQQLKNLMEEKLTEARIAFAEVKTVGTPRRLTAIVRDVAERQADIQREHKGPSINIAFTPDGQPTKAALGFARSQGVDVSQLVRRDNYVYAIVNEEGKDSCLVLPTLLSDIITSLSFPKSMRWADIDMRFVRPIRWLVALYGEQVIDFSVAGIASGRITRGHRFLGSEAIELQRADDYIDALAANYVMVDQDQRRQVIRRQVTDLAAAHGGVAKIDEDLLEEVLYLVEYPTALCGKFAPEYLELPAAVIITPMQEHQRYFPVTTVDGKLMPLFITVRDGGSDYLDIVRQGNERVLKARLADARFFFEEDKKTKLADKVEKLKTVVFQEGLGTMYDKTLRLQQLAASIGRAAGVEEADLQIIDRSAYLAKADLVTSMVTEFTELQGVMGKEYARIDGEKPAVAEAIFEHYLPRFAGDALPQTSAGAILSIADKLDNIVATFSRGLMPTGSQDPFALRRQALGITNILIQSQLHLSLTAMVNKAMDLIQITAAEQRRQLIADISEFFRVRLKGLLNENQVRYDLIDAVLAKDIDDIYATWLKGLALAKVSAEEGFKPTVQALTRVNHLASKSTGQEIRPQLFSTASESELYAAYLKAKDSIAPAVEQHDYQAVFKALATLNQPIDKFFDSVMVMVEDEAIRNNRLALLHAIDTLAGYLADFNKIVVV